MIQLIIVGGLVFFVAYYWYAMRQSERRLKQLLASSEIALAKPSYRCVKIEYGNQACQQVKSFQAKPILVNDAPRLPLPDCHVTQCDCKFIRFDDRRSGEDRRMSAAEAVANAKIYADKRVRRDRRRASLQQFLTGSSRNFSRSV
ncbi:MAG: hypothetical protein B7X95_02770 [Methylophilaceae bacterium 17-44-8]|jgi:hypothetical protein|nr:MAG: hypothetical protein B7Y48_00805 [Methylophilales bacterium 28-44-11]OZA06455.1 MAG: hypothetical protein B7X95_02770 [Methylophilaceae bacterium 17-44-8]